MAEITKRRSHPRSLRSSRIETGARWGHPVEILKESAGRDLIVMAAQSHSTPRVVA
jgi:hypothetical protein